MNLFKFAFCVALAAGSALLFAWRSGRPWESRFFRTASIAGIILKFVASLALYLVYPKLNSSSDAALFYFPQTLQFMAGKLPYRDFTSSYSVLFCPLLSLPLHLWRSVGAIVLTMLLAETGMIWAYASREPERDPARRWRTIFLYTFSPISFYWVAMVGYNGAIIALFSMLALVLAERGRHLLAGVCAALGFLTVKLLAVLSWPGIVAFEPRHRWRRALPMALALGATIGLGWFGLNAWMPITRELGKSTSGNLWMLLALVAPGNRSGPLWRLLPMALFGAAFVPLFIRFTRASRDEISSAFDRSAAFIAATGLLFMILSRKSFTMYLPMTLLPLIHTVTGAGAGMMKRLLPVALLGATTTLEPHLWTMVRDRAYSLANPATLALLLVDLIVVGCYAVLLLECVKASLQPPLARARPAAIA